MNSQEQRILELKKYYPALPDNLTVGGSLDLENTAITALPDNLTVGGSLDLSGTAITGSVYNCGNYGRTICAYKHTSGNVVVSLGCFVGTLDECAAKISEKYTGRDAEEYISKVRQAFDNYKKRTSNGRTSDTHHLHYL
jgi:hypothetical protein